MNMKAKDLLKAARAKKAEDSSAQAITVTPVEEKIKTETPKVNGIESKEGKLFTDLTDSYKGKSK